jgi:pimeloyl-ACP methyl ester carboxylesterase
VLAAPAATLFPLPGAWAWRGILGVLPPHRFFMTRFLTSWMCRDLSRKGDPASKQALEHWTNDALMALECFAFRMPVAPTVLSDDELRRLAVPVLLILGEHEVVYPPEPAFERARSLAPSVTTALIADAGHDLTIAQTDAFNRHVVSFLRP